MDAGEHKTGGRTGWPEFAARVTAHTVRGATATPPNVSVERTRVRACYSTVKAQMIPTDIPEARRPVSFAAPRIVAVRGWST